MAELHRLLLASPITRAYLTGTGIRFDERLPVVTKELWAQIEAAARIPRKGRHYREIVEAPDGSIYAAAVGAAARR